MTALLSLTDGRMNFDAKMLTQSRSLPSHLESEIHSANWQIAASMKRSILL